MKIVRSVAFLPVLLLASSLFARADDGLGKWQFDPSPDTPHATLDSGPDFPKIEVSCVAADALGYRFTMRNGAAPNYITLLNYDNNEDLSIEASGFMPRKNAARLIGWLAETLKQAKADGSNRPESEFVTQFGVNGGMPTPVPIGGLMAVRERLRPLCAGNKEAAATSPASVPMTDGPNERFYGVWLGLNSDLHLNPDGTYKITFADRSETGSWSASETDLVFKSEESVSVCGYDKTVETHLLLAPSASAGASTPCRIQGAYWSEKRAETSASTMPFACTVNANAVRRISSPLLQFRIFDGSGPVLLAADSKDRIVYLHKDGVDRHFVVRNDNIYQDHIAFMVRFDKGDFQNIEISKDGGMFNMSYYPSKCSQSGGMSVCAQVVSYPIGTCMKVVR
ncbi:hypothetical protein [Pleomorphomonas oryzae]|uniref:hypothetical protein n=1 Tax=Pleomorphomonas oryzae TaxID=261934 RepID=UPI000412858E|nr:hypothetical protein [Pleomorphomonas oryzae]